MARAIHSAASCVIFPFLFASLAFFIPIGLGIELGGVSATTSSSKSIGDSFWKGLGVEYGAGVEYGGGGHGVDGGSTKYGWFLTLSQH